LGSINQVFTFGESLEGHSVKPGKTTPATKN
jgi:hypothetical protein